MITFYTVLSEEEQTIGNRILNHAKWYLVHDYAVRQIYGSDPWLPPIPLTQALIIMDNLIKGWPAFYIGDGEDLQ